MSWDETLHANSNITFEVRASDTAFAKDASSPAWIPVSGTSPVTSGLPSGRYMQWQASLSTSNNLYTPVLHSVMVGYSTSPEVTTAAASNITANSATLNGNMISRGTATTVNVSFQWGTTSGVYDHETTPQAMTAPGVFNANLSSLGPNTTYYFRAKADGGASGIGYGAEMSYTTSTIPPSVTTQAASSTTANSATLNGALASTGTATTVNVSFQWGTTSGGPYPNSTAMQVMNAPGNFQANLSSLGPNTIYYYRAKADGGGSGTTYGAEMSFITSKVPPSVVTGGAGSVTSSSATLNGSLASMGTASMVNVSFQYGTTQGGPYPNSTSLQAMTAPGSFTANLTGLTANTTYYFKDKGDGGAHGTGYGSEVSFTTSKVPPSVDTSGATNIASGSATLNGQLTFMGTATTVNVSFLWGTEADNLNMETTSQTLTVPIGFNADLAGLSPYTTYYYQAKANGGAHGTSYGAVMNFRTSKVPPSVTTNEASGVTADSAALNGTLHSLGSAPTVDVSFQYSTTSGMYSNETTPQTLSAAADFQAALSGLSAATTYYYRAKGDGGIHGIDYGTEHVFTTGRVPPSVVTGNATNLTTNSAALNGNLTALGTATTVNVSFQYGITQGGPYPNSSTTQARTATDAFQINLTALSPRTTYYYRAKADGGTSGTDYGAEASFMTGSFPPYVETLPATGTTDHASTLNGKLHFLGSATTANVYFVYGTVEGGPYPDSTTKQAMTATGDFQAALSGLTPGTTYYYRAKGDGGIYGISAGAEMAFTTSKIPPSVTTNAATNVTSDSATLNGNLDALGDAATDNVSFQWGTQHGGPYIHSTPQQAMTATGIFQAVLTDLEGNSTYYFRAKGDGGIYGTAYGAEGSFITSKVPPTVETDNATLVAATSAGLRGFLESMGTAGSVDTWFVYGTIKGGPYSGSTTKQAMHSRGYLATTVLHLSPLTIYYFRAEADGGAHGTAEGEEYSFTTKATPPSVSTGGATSVATDSATLNGSLHSLGTATTVNVSFQYGTRSGVYSEETALQAKSARGDFTANLNSLRPGTTYYYRAKGDGGAHGTSYGDEYAFTTGTLPPTMTTNAATHMTTDTARLNGSLDSLGTANRAYVSFVYGATAGGPYTSSTSPQTMTSAGAYETYVTGLSPYTTYYFKARAMGGVYGAAFGAEKSFTTNRLPPVMWTEGAVDIMTNAAILNGNLHLLGSASTVNVSFEYGTTSGGPYTGTTPQAMNAPESFQARLTGLLPDITYYYRAKGDGGADGIGYGVEHAFTTGAHPPIVATSDAGNIAADSATLNGNLLNRGSATTVNVSFVYGTTQGGPYTGSTTPQSMIAVGAFPAVITGLSPHTAYYFKAKADGGIYGVNHGREKSFITTLAPPSVTTEAASSVTTDEAILNGDLTSLGRAGTVNVSFLYGTTPGGPYSNITPPQATTTAGAFNAALNGLSSGVTYYYMAKADGGVYGIAYGLERSFTTITIPPPAPPPPPPRLPGSSGGLTSSIPPVLPVSLPNVVVQSATLSAGRVLPGDPVEITATVYNRGTVNGNIVIRLYVNGQEAAVRSVTLESGKSRNIIFTTVQNSPGTYTVYVGGIQAGSFVVEEYFDPDIILFISMGLVLTSLVLAVMYVWRRRQQEY